MTSARKEHWKFCQTYVAFDNQKYYVWYKVDEPWMKWAVRASYFWTGRWDV